MSNQKVKEGEQDTPESILEELDPSEFKAFLQGNEVSQKEEQEEVDDDISPDVEPSQENQEETEEVKEDKDAEDTGVQDEEQEEGEEEKLESPDKSLSDRLDEVEGDIQKAPRQNLELANQVHLRKLDTFQNEVNQFNTKAPTYTDGNKTVLEMDQTELDAYIDSLHQEGKSGLANRVLKELDDYKTEYGTLVEKQKKLQNESNQIDAFRQQVEWDEIEKDFKQKFPEVTEEEIQQIGNFMESRRTSDTNYAAALQTKDGKVFKIKEAAMHLGVFARLREEADKQKDKDPKPNKQLSAPDARMVSKKVKHSGSSSGQRTYSEEDISSMSQEQFNKLPEDVVEKLLRGELIEG